MGVAMGLISSMLGVGGGLGLVMSGVIVDHASWRWLFVVGALFGVLAWAWCAASCRPSPHRSPATLDIPGALLLSAGLICILVGLTRGALLGLGTPRAFSAWSAPGSAILVVSGVVEARTRQPMVDMRMLSRRPVLFTNLAALFCGFTMYAIFTVLPLFSQMPSGLPAAAASLVTYGFGASVTVSALYLLPGALVMLPAGPFGGVLGRWVGFRVALAIGLLVTATGSALLAAFHAEPWQLMLGYAIGAGGVAIAFGAMPKLIADAVSPTETGIATGMNTVVRTVGSVIGSQVAVTLLASDTIGRTSIPAESGFTTSLWLGAGGGPDRGAARPRHLLAPPGRRRRRSPPRRAEPGGRRRPPPLLLGLERRRRPAALARPAVGADRVQLERHRAARLRAAACSARPAGCGPPTTGIHQFHRPSTDTKAGSSMLRTIVASRTMPIASAVANTLMSVPGDAASAMKARNRISDAGGHQAPGAGEARPPPRGRWIRRGRTPRASG